MSVNLSPVGGAAAQFFDNNGNPLSGGKLYTYAAGTTTPLASYTTSAGNVPHTNPIILDSAGRVPGGQIWLTDGDIDYKFLLETSTNVLVGTFDNIPPAISGNASDIAVVASTYNTGTTVQAQLTNVGSATGATNVGFTPAGTGAVANTVQAKFREGVNVMDFIPVSEHAAIYSGNSTYDCSASIQAAYLTLSTYSSFDAGTTFYGFQSRLLFPAKKGVFLIGTTLTFNSAYVDIDFGGSIIKPTAGFDLSTFAIDFPAIWVAKVAGMSLAKFTNNVRLNNNNEDAGVIAFSSLQIAGGNVGFSINCRSSLVSFTDYKIHKVKQVAIITAGDRVLFNRGWLYATALSSDFDGIFVLNSDFAPSLELVDMFYVPAPQTALRCSVVKIVKAARVLIERGLFGGEPGQIALVANFAQAVEPVSRGVRITINNTSAYTTGSAMVELYALPNSVSCSNINGLLDESRTLGLIAYREDFVTFSASKALLLNYLACQITINGLMPINFQGLSRNELARLAQYVITPLKLTFNYVTGVSNIISATIVQLTANELRRSGYYKIKISNIGSNPGANRYSEYVVCGGFSGGSGDLSIVPVLLGSASTAARVSISGDSFVILTNGDPNLNNFGYSIEKICSPTEQYP